jgi:hypothetical protein
MTLPVDVAVYAEHSDDRIAVKPNWNPRIFNRTEVEEGSRIRFDPASGAVRLGPGVYHIAGSSQVTYNDLTQHPDEPGWNTEVIPNGGYCRLRYAADADAGNDRAIVVGTISNANMVPSLVETYLDVPAYAEVVLEHQVGFREQDVAGIYLQDNSAESSWHVFARLTIRRVGDSAAQHERSAMCSVFNAAFREYLADPEPYRQLLATYLGVLPKFVPTAEAGAWVRAGDPALAAVLERGVLRFGYTEAPPYVYHLPTADPAVPGELAGLDWELGNALTAIIRGHYFAAAPHRGLRAEWVRVDVSGQGDAEVGKFDAMVGGLRDGRFDVAMAGQANISNDFGSSASTREVDWTTPTALLFTNVLYTGLGREGPDGPSEEMSDLVDASRDRFIARVATWPEVIVMCVINAGPSPTNSAALVAEINAAGGNARLERTYSLQEVQDAIAQRTIHFSVGDAVASAWIGNQPGFRGLNLNIAAATKPLQTAQQVAAFTLPAG